MTGYLINGRNRFIKVENWHEDLIADVIRRQIYEIRFSKFAAVFCENEMLGLYRGPKDTTGIYPVHRKKIS
jgi:hypothetical protein